MFPYSMQQPPRLTAIAHGKLSTYVCSEASRIRTNRSAATLDLSPYRLYSLARAASEAPAGLLVRISLVQRQRDIEDPLEKF
jgi:hypothetical protein